jgi:hypothetical protein
MLELAEDCCLPATIAAAFPLEKSERFKKVGWDKQQRSFTNFNFQEKKKALHRSRGDAVLRARMVNGGRPEHRVV